MIVLFIAVGLLVADEGDEEAKFGDLDGDGLDIHAVEAVFDEVELAAVVVVVVGEGAFQFPSMTDPNTKIEQSASDIFAALEKAVGSSDKEGVGRALSDILIRYNLNPEELEDRIGVRSRTLRRWAKGEGRPPSLSSVRLWRPLIERTAGAASSPSIANERAPRFYSPEQITERIAFAAEVWDLRCRAEFRANYSKNAIEVLLRRIFETAGNFRLNCVWIEPNESLQESKNLLQIRPASAPKISFGSICKDLKEEAERANFDVAKIEEKVRGFEIPLAAAALLGLSNGPTSNLILVYPDKSRFGARVECFIEISAAWYRNSDVNSPDISVEEHVSVQIHPSLAQEYWSEIWKLSELESHSRVFSLCFPEGRRSKDADGPALGKAILGAESSDLVVQK